jgi:hypothetical protein
MLLQPSVVFGAVTPTPVNPDAAAAPNPPAAPVNQQPVNQPAPQSFTPGGPPQLRIGTRVLIIVPGLRILEHQAPGLRAQTAGGAVAEVTRNPQDPSVLGLTNLSSTSWEIVTAKGNRHQIPSGQTVKLSAGTKIDFGVLDGEIR